MAAYGCQPPLCSKSDPSRLSLSYGLVLQRRRVYPWASKFGAVAPKTRSSFPTRKGSRQLRATLSWMSGESRDLPHAARAFDLFLGGLPQQTVASVDHRETPQQFDKMATADLYRDLLISDLAAPQRALVCYSRAAGCCSGVHGTICTTYY